MSAWPNKRLAVNLIALLAILALAAAALGGCGDGDGPRAHLRRLAVKRRAAR